MKWCENGSTLSDTDQNPFGSKSPSLSLLSQANPNLRRVYFILETMGTTCDAKDIAKRRPFAIAIPSTDSTHSRPGMNLCPAYRFCREIKKSYGFPVLNSNDHDQQVSIFSYIFMDLCTENAILYEKITLDFLSLNNNLHRPIYEHLSSVSEENNQPVTDHGTPRFVASD